MALIKNCHTLFVHFIYIVAVNIAMLLFLIIKWSGISPYFARLWLADTAFTALNPDVGL